MRAWLQAVNVEGCTARGIKQLIHARHALSVDEESSGAYRGSCGGSDRRHSHRDGHDGWIVDRRDRVDEEWTLEDECDLLLADLPAHLAGPGASANSSTANTLPWAI